MYISFIAPTYKVDKYLDDFFESFLGLSQKVDFEIILVNDEVGKNLSLWVEKYNDINIKVINNKKNVGQGPSRVFGIQHISEKSTHVIFIDPDDKLNNHDFIKDISKNEIVNFSLNRWFKNKSVFDSASGDVSKYKVNNVIHGISFPRKVALDIKNYSQIGESNDMPIKLRMSKKYKFIKTNTVMIDYRIRKSSTINTRRSERRAMEEVQTWKNLLNEGLIENQKANNNIYFELIINKKSFNQEWYNNEINIFKKRTTLLNKFNSISYRTFNFWKFKNLLINFIFNRKMFE